MRTAVVILNWNTRQYLEDFLPALLSSVDGIEGAEVVVADNASTDSSLEMLAERFPGVKTIALDSNYGFTGGYNRAFAQLLAGPGSPEYLLLLNSDILVDKGWLEPLLDWMDRHPDCAACGPKLHALTFEGGRYVKHDRFEYAGAAGGLLDRFGFPYCRGRVLKHTEEDHGQYDDPAEVLWVSGACLLTRSSVWRQLGGLDERFFAHMEEIDFCWRSQLTGMKVSVVPQSCVWHLGGGTLPQSSPFKLKLNFRNGLLLLDNNLAASIGPARAWIRIATRRILDNGAALLYLLSGKPGNFSAVRQAHKEYRQLRKEPHNSMQSCSGTVTGLTGRLVFWEYLTKK